MKWYKHDTNANMDEKLQEVLLDYGLEGYGLYWYCLELVAQRVEADRLTFELAHDARIIARNTGSTPQRVEEIMKKFISLELFEASEGVITCMKLAKRADDYTTKLVKSKLSQAVDSKGVLESPRKSEKVPLDKNRIDKNRIDKNNKKLFDIFYDAYPKKIKRPKAEKAFKKITPEELDLILENIKKQFELGAWNPNEKQFIPSPEAYINGRRWEDEIIPRAGGAVERFVKPTIDEVEDFLSELNANTPYKADQIWNNYESKGWMIGGAKIVDWRASVKAWIAKDAAEASRK
jgi:hypothetical protein